MDAVDRFVQDGVFENNRHRHIFEDGETREARERWLREIDQICKATGTAYVVREVTRNEQPGYEFAFTNKAAYAAFVFNAFGDLEEPGGHIQSYAFTNEGPAYREAFFLAAETHLAALGIEHQWREQDGKLEFAFDRFSDRLMFDALIEQGTIDASAKGLESVKSMQRRLGLDTAPPQQWPDFDLG